MKDRVEFVIKYKDINYGAAIEFDSIENIQAGFDDMDDLNRATKLNILAFLLTGDNKGVSIMTANQYMIDNNLRINNLKL